MANESTGIGLLSKARGDGRTTIPEGKAKA